MKTVRLKLEDGSKMTFEVPNEWTPEQIQVEAERKVGELRAQGVEPSRPTPPTLRPPPPPPWRGTANDPLNDEIRCGICPVPSSPVKRRDLTKHMIEMHPQVFVDDGEE